MIDLRFVPLTQWPGEPTKARRNAAFRSTYIKTLDLLESELKKINAREVVIQAFYAHDQIRNDGWPRANQQPSHPGVILGFKKPEGEVFVRDGKRMVHLVPLSFPCDTYHHLEHNIHAIALSLEALRAVDRYGVTKRSEQYAGWKQIAPPPAGDFPNKEAAARFIARQGGFSEGVEDIRKLVEDAGLRRIAYRDAAKRLHPDSKHPTADQTPGLWDRLNQALSLLEASQ